jgi:hypothetical protein
MRRRRQSRTAFADEWGIPLREGQDLRWKAVLAEGEPDSEELLAVVVVPVDASDPEPAGPELARTESDALFPSEFFFCWNGDPRVVLKLVVEDGVLICTQMTVLRRPGGDRLKASKVRVRLDAMVQLAGVLAGAAPRHARGKTRWVSPNDLEESEFGEFTAGLQPPRRGKRLEQAHYERVAEVYKAALRRGQPPTQAVARAMHTARSNAGRWVMEARSRGLLPPAQEEKGGNR